jgi:hypothetical protein
MGAMIINQAFKFRLYPNAEQRQALDRQFGCPDKSGDSARFLGIYTNGFFGLLAAPCQIRFCQ